MMARGRKKDLTIPPTRALIQQRDYRARRAHYVAGLEERCRKAEEENAQLRKEVEALRNAQTPALFSNPYALQASSELMHNLALASASLTRFQEMAVSQHSEPASALHYKDTSACGASSPQPTRPVTTSSTGFRPASFPSPSPSPSTSVPYDATMHSTGHKRLFRENSPDAPAMPQRAMPSTRAPTPESDCCGGFLDCRDLVETEEEMDNSISSRTSRLRSTSLANALERRPAPC